MYLLSSSKCLEYLVGEEINQIFSLLASVSTPFKEKKVLLPQYIISSLNPFKMCPVLHTGTDKDLNVMTGWRHFLKKHKLYYTNGGNHYLIICFQYFS